MSNKTRAFFLSLTIVAMLLASAVGTTTVYADDGTTTGSTETGTTTTDTDQGDDPSVVETPPPAEDQPTDATDLNETPVPEDEQVTDAAEVSVDQVETPPAVEEQPAEVTPPLLEQLPDNTTVTVVDEEGEAQTLVAQESAEAVVLSDPIWCPATVTVPTPGENGCTASYSSFTELLEFLEANEGDPLYQQAGTIYVEQGNYLGGEEVIDFNSYNFTNLSQQDLTIQGGWDTSDNSLDSTSNFNVPIIIGSSSNPWVGSLTFNNIFITGADGTGLTVYSQGDINLSNVEVTNSTDGALLNAGGNVSVKNSKFNNNGSGTIVDANGTDLAINWNADGAGLSINGGSVTLEQVEANNNQLYGTDIISTGIVTVTNSFFNGNISYAFPPTGSWEYYGYGLQVVTAGDIVVQGVTANENLLFGANLDGANVTVTDSFFSNNGSFFEEDPTGYGLQVNATGTVTLISIEANNNELFGANIAAGSSVIVRDSFFNGNYSFQYVNNEKVFSGYGLQVVTIADVAVRDVTAEGNALLGAHVEGSDIAIRDSSFSSNGSGSGLDLIGKGLEVVSISDPIFGNGNVSLFNVIADNNQVFGANIQSAGDVAVGGVSSFSGTIAYIYDTNTGNVLEVLGGYGLQIVTQANIALQGVTANNNYLYGTSLQGADVAVAESFFSHNGSGILTNPVGFGLQIVSTGAVALRTVEASYNQLFGADIQAVGNVDIGADEGQFNYFNGNMSVSLDPCGGVNFFGYGLTVYTTEGDITLNYVEANFNNLWGGSLNGMDVDVANSRFNNNISDSTQFIDDTGLIINSRGDFVGLNNVEARENRLIGATITAVGDVYIVNSTFTDNAGFTCLLDWCPEGSLVYHGYGLSVVTPGLISLDGVNASNNNLFGAHLEGGNITVTNSSFNNNGTGEGNTPEGRGLEIISSGAVTIALIEANNNQLFGANVQAVGDVTVTASDFIGNFYIVGGSPVGYGLQVVTLGNITLVSDNTGYGVQGYENGSGAILQGANVTVTDSNFYNNGSGNGLTITATGNVTLTNVTATSNGQNGVDITVDACSVVQVNGGTFSENGEYGLSVDGGTLTLDGTQTFANNGTGNVFQNPGNCVIVINVSTPSTGDTVVTNNDGRNTTVGSGAPTQGQVIDKKTNKPKKSHFHKNKMAKKKHGRLGNK
ncbi:MAG: hypothetical protein HXY35_11995 [Chloroflexi bacterium]|nr:hypothetical protein [Chloroflexota bacterium]